MKALALVGLLMAIVAALIVIGCAKTRQRPHRYLADEGWRR